MDVNEIRKKFFEFQIENGHKVIQPAPLVLEGDPTTLFTGSGMQPLLPYLLGKDHPDGTRLCDSQPSMRMQDIEDVGDPRHTTVFEMLGNWSLGDYFKEEQIRNFFKFLTEIVGLDPEKIYVTCFIGNEKYGIPKDEEAAEIWQKVFKEAGIEAKVAEIGTAAEGDKRGIKPGERIFGVVAVAVNLRRSVIRVGQIRKCFMISVMINRMPKSMAWHTRLRMALDLWRLATRSLCSIVD